MGEFVYYSGRINMCRRTKINVFVINDFFFFLMTDADNLESRVADKITLVHLDSYNTSNKESKGNEMSDCVLDEDANFVKVYCIPVT